MVVFLIFCLFVDGKESTTDVSFLVVNNSSVIEIPGAFSIAENIGSSLPDFSSHSRHFSPGDKTRVSPNQARQQFHGVATDSQGKYFTRSIQAHKCEIEENLDNFFYENITRQFQEDAVVFIPCLADGIPSPVKSVQRCEDESCIKATDVTDGLVTHDGHVIYERGLRSHTGWYRCHATNACGTVDTAPIYISIRKEKPEMSRPGCVVSRRTNDFSINYVEDKSTEIHLERKITPYELWRMNTTKPSYSDEVVFLDAIHNATEQIYLFYYPYHSAYGSSEELSLTGVVDGPLHYGAVTHNNSYVTHFSNLRLVVDFDTEFYNAPQIQNPDNSIFNSPTKIILTFLVLNDIPKKYNDISNFMCFKDTVPLVDSSWKTSISTSPDDRSRTRIVITLFYPLSRDSGYYQCAVQYDVLYVSEETFVKIDSPADFHHPSTSDITPSSVRLQWDTPQRYTGAFIVFLSDNEQSSFNPLDSPTNSLPVTHLTPYKQYHWYVTTTSQQPVTDLRTFITLAAPPESNIGLISVLRLDTALQLSWTEFPVSSWYDDRVYFLVSTVGVNSTGRGDIRNQTSHINVASVEGLQAATLYIVTVTACNSVGCSENASSINATTEHSVLETSPIISILYTSQTFVDVTAAFNDSSTDEVFLEMFSGSNCHSASPSPSTPLIHLKTKSRDRLDHLDSFTDYSVRARATNGFSTSPWSKCVNFKTRFSWWVPVIPVVCVSVLLIMVMVVRAVIRIRCPDVINKVKQALEPKYVNIFHHEDDWETSNEVAIIHTQFEDCDL